MPSAKRASKNFCQGIPATRNTRRLACKQRELRSRRRLRTWAPLTCLRTAFSAACACATTRRPSRRCEASALLFPLRCSTFWPDAGTTGTYHIEENGIFRRLSPDCGRRRLTTTEDDSHAHTTLAGRMMHTPLSLCLHPVSPGSLLHPFR